MAPISQYRPQPGRIKISLSPEDKAFLEAIAKKRGLPLSQLILQSALDHLRQPVAPTCPLGPKLDRALAILEAIERPKFQAGQSNKPSKKDLVTVKVPGRVETIESLIERWGLQDSKSLKATLSQLGGRDGWLFLGSLPHAQKVADVTSEYDPEGLPWLPIDSYRHRWTQVSPVEYCLALLSSSGFGPLGNLRGR